MYHCNVLSYRNLLGGVFEGGHAPAELEEEVDAELDAFRDSEGKSTAVNGSVPYGEGKLAKEKCTYNAPLQWHIVYLNEDAGHVHG